MGMQAVPIASQAGHKTIEVYGRILLTDNYVANGDTLDLGHLDIPSSLRPLRVEAWSEVNQGMASAADSYIYVPGNGLTDGVLQILVAGVEMAGGAAYAGTAPTNTAGYRLLFKATFAKFL